jgi:hypothetical protein
MANLFISYAREDRRTAARLARLLESEEWQVWWDFRLLAGEAFDEAIDSRLRTADAVLVLWSSSSASSRWVKAEADVGLARGVLIPARLGDAEIPLPFGRLHAADLAGWRGEATHPGIEEIRQALGNLQAGDAPDPTRTARPPRRLDAGRRRRMPIGTAAAIAAVVLAAFLAVILTRTGSPSAPGDTTGSLTIPQLVGMRYDEALLELERVGVAGPGIRDAAGMPFPEDEGEALIMTRVVDVSPPAGSTISATDPDVTLYLEWCTGICSPRTGATD